MKISILKNNLKFGLQTIERITPKSLSLPILNNVLLTTENNFLCLISTDLEMAAKYCILGKIDKPGKITIPAKIFSNLINSSYGEKIDLEVKNNTLLVTGENWKTQLNGQNVNDFPVVPTIKKEKSITVNCIPFCQGLIQIIAIVSTSQTRPEISGVYFKIRNNGIVLAATDTYRLAEKQLFFSENKEKGETVEEYSFIVPSKIIKELIYIFGDKEGELEIQMSKNQIGFEYKQQTTSLKINLISRLIEGEFPNYQEIIPQKYDTEITIAKNELLENHIRTASILSPKTNEIALDIRTDQKQIDIYSESPDMGTYGSKMQLINCKGENIKIGFNWKFINDGLVNIKSQEIIFGLQKNEKPAIIKPVGDHTYIYIVMPMRS